MKLKFLPLLLLAALAAAMTASAADAPSVSRVKIASIEKNLDDRLSRLWGDSALTLVGPTRGVYLPSYGIVFSAELNLAPGPSMMMGMSITDAEKAAMRKKRIERLPQLRTALKDYIRLLAGSVEGVPDNEQVVIALLLPRYSWEDPKGTPIQVTVQGSKQELIAAQQAKGAAADAPIKITETF